MNNHKTLQWIKEETRREIKKKNHVNKNRNTTYHNLSDAAKAVI